MFPITRPTDYRTLTGFSARPPFRRMRLRLTFDLGIVASVNRRTDRVYFLSGLSQAIPELRLVTSLAHCAGWVTSRVYTMATAPTAPSVEALQSLLNGVLSVISTAERIVDPTDRAQALQCRGVLQTLQHRITRDWPHLLDVGPVALWSTRPPRRVRRTRGTVITLAPIAYQLCAD